MKLSNRLILSVNLKAASGQLHTAHDFLLSELVGLKRGKPEQIGLRVSGQRLNTLKTTAIPTKVPHEGLAMSVESEDVVPREAVLGVSSLGRRRQSPKEAVFRTSLVRLQTPRQNLIRPSSR